MRAYICSGSNVGGVGRVQVPAIADLHDVENYPVDTRND